MLKIEYEIKINDNGRPYIQLSNDYENRPEDKFFVIELSRYLLQNVYNRRSKEFDETTADKIDIAIRLLGQVSDEIAELLYGQMESMGDIAVSMGGSHHIQVSSFEERDAIPEKGYLYDRKIFNRQEGLKVLIINETDKSIPPYASIYMLMGGITNEHWITVA